VSLPKASGPLYYWPQLFGSGIMGERLSGGNAALALLANAIATGATLVTLIFTFGPVSGAHFNPAMTLADISLSFARACIASSGS
jgi:glycerol uptake facilitator-like aquaporin